MPYASHVSDLAFFQQKLIGTWKNDGVPLGKDGKPLSYNVMPLPQVEPQKGYPCCLGYILKNFTFTETIRFNDPKAITIPALAPNRGGRYTQNSHALFYDQQVYFAEGPGKGNTVHVENGAWLHLTSAAQPLGPYNNVPAKPGPIIQQPPFMTVAKQIAVPHGNSVLALGSYQDKVKGAPDIPDLPFPYPGTGEGAEADVSAFPYYTQLINNDDYENPNPDYTLNPNRPLQELVKAIKPDCYVYWRVTTDPLPDVEHEIAKGSVTNIPFEQKRANASSYCAEYWLLSTDGGKSFDYLAYNQVINLTIPLMGQPYNFPHITANTVKRT